MGNETLSTSSAINLFWAAPQKKIFCQGMPCEAININVHGRAPTSPHQGFGRMWLRTYRVRLPANVIDPVQLMSIWKSNFSHLWPPGNHFFTTPKGIQPGEVGLINLSLPGGLKLATGALISYVDDASFSLMTVQGHMFSGWITFSCYGEDHFTYAQTQALIRPNDLIYELSFLLGFGRKAEDGFWQQTMKNLAAHFGEQANVEQTVRLIDSSLQWKYFGNLWYNAGIRSGLYQVFTPVRKFIYRVVPSNSRGSK
jgi:hypothetical protein